MSQTYLAKLENAFLDCSELGSTAQQRDYLANLASKDADLARELSSILSLQGEWADILDMSGGQFCSIMFTTLGEEKKTETKNDLIEFLKLVSPSEAKDGIANLQGIELKELVGVGATGFVFKGWDTDLSRYVAVKILAPSIAKNERHRLAFVAEARMASALKHPHIISIYHIYSNAATSMAYFVAEWIEGFTLQKWIVDRNTNDSLAPEEKWLRQLVDAVAEAHENGIVHRDLKPANVLVDQETQNAILIDFGLAFEKKDWRGSNSPKGTPLYMSPEQLKGERLSQQSDLFALSEIACLLLYDCHPFQEATIESLTKRVLFEDPSFSPKVPRPAQEVFQKALSKQAGDRHRSAREFYSDLQRARGVENLDADIPGDSKWKDEGNRSPAREQSMLRQRSLVLLIAALLLVALPLLYYGLQGLGQTQNSNQSQAQSSNQENSPDLKIDKDINQDLRIGNLPFTNFLGMTFQPSVLNTNKLDNWPSKEEDPNKLFSNVDWRNRAKIDKFYIAEQFVTNEQYQQVMGKLPPAKKAVKLQDPITGINYFEALAFARKLQELDPRGLKYGIYKTDEFAFLMYGEAYFSAPREIEQISSDFAKALANQKSGLSNAFPLQNAFGDLKEWTGRESRVPTKQEGVVSYESIPAVAASDFIEVVGGFSGELFLHIHDLNFGMNDHFVAAENLERFVEEDGITSYLCPIQKGELGTLTYRYEFDAPLKTANISDPFSLYSETSSAGLRVRVFREKDRENWDQVPWIEIFEVDGMHMQSPPLRNFDLTELAQGCSALEIQYWVKSGDDKLNYSQIGRTIARRSYQERIGPAHGLPEVFRFEALIDKTCDSLRSATPVPDAFRSENISFRVMFRVD